MNVNSLSNVAAPDLPGVVKASRVELHQQMKDGWIDASVLHAAGCKHNAGRDEVSSFDVAENVQYSDDYYYVAPCAKKPNCDVAGDNHSADLNEIFDGRELPMYRCGYHVQRYGIAKVES